MLTYPLSYEQTQRDALELERGGVDAERERVSQLSSKVEGERAEIGLLQEQVVNPTP